nr:tRNA pseudouridine(38-40) synthase TruA [Luteolibacter marinus]
MTLAFDGAAYHGWQGQRSGRGVEDQVQAALGRLFPGASPLVASSRTDAGVHARGLVAHFEAPRDEFKMPPRHLALAINALLPDDIRVLAAVRVRAAFNARFDAISKQYRYTVWNHPVMDPLRRGQAWHVPRPLNVAAMRAAAALFVGTHDFRAFTSKRPGVLKDPVRTLTRCEVRRRGPELTVVIEGSGFLYKMCRAITGTLVQLGEGRLPADGIGAMLAGGDRRTAGMNAPAHGLVLWQVRYRRR